MKQTLDTYDDIIDLPYPRRSTHPLMPLSGRAAQFAPFAALHGHSEAIDDAAHQREQKEMEEMYGIVDPTDTD